MKERNLRLRLGLFVLAALVALGVLVIMFGSAGPSRWFKPTSAYSIVFAEAPGVAPGTPVRLSGVRIGEVTDVQLDNETGTVKVGVAVEKRFTIRHNERPTLSASVIGGDTVIDFIPQTKPLPLDKTAVQPGETLAGEVQPSVSTLVSRASEVVPTTQDLMNDIRKSLQKLETLTPEVEATLREYRELAKDARGIVPDVKKTTAQVQDFVRSVQDVMPEVKAAVKEIRKAAATLNEPAAEARPAPPEANEVAFRARPARPEDKEPPSALKKLMQSLNDALPELRKTNKDLQDLIKAATDVMPDVKTTVRDLGAAAQQYNKLGEDLDKLVRDNQTKIGRIIDNLNATLDRTLDLLSNENRRNVADTLRNVRNATERLPEMSKDLDEMLKEFKETAKRLRETMTKADETLTGARDLMRGLGERGPNILRNLDEGSDKLNKLLGDARELLRVVGESDGTFRRFLTDPALYNHIDEAVCMIGKTIPRLDRILKDFETFADKLARHPETIGVSGVVKPGSGLKDPPAPYPGRVVPPGH